jgi:hypothetical protein
MRLAPFPMADRDPLWPAVPDRITSGLTEERYCQKYQGWREYLAVLRELKKKVAERVRIVRPETSGFVVGQS